MTESAAHGRGAPPATIHVVRGMPYRAAGWIRAFLDGRSLWLTVVVVAFSTRHANLQDPQFAPLLDHLYGLVGRGQLSGVAR